MLGAARDDKLIRFVVGELHCIANHVSPQSARGSDNQRVVFMEFHLFQTKHFGVFFADFFQRNEFVEYAVVNHQQHGRVCRVILCTEVTF